MRRFSWPVDRFSCRVSAAGPRLPAPLTITLRLDERMDMFRDLHHRDIGILSSGIVIACLL